MSQLIIKKPKLEWIDHEIRLTPVFEDENLFQTRKQEVQILLTDMFLRSKKRGRPKADEEEVAYAA